jgi:hypothetical protein
VGFKDLWISDHYHPCNDVQGRRSSCRSTIGAIATGAPRMGSMAARGIRPPPAP